MELTKSVAPRKEDQDEREPAAGHPSKPPLVPWWKDTETTESLPGNSYRRTDAQTHRHRDVRTRPAVQLLLTGHGVAMKLG